MTHGLFNTQSLRAGGKTAHCRVEVILKATLWMEEKYRQVPNGKIAAMIALHHLMLAMRREYHAEPQTVEEHITHALAWWKAANHEPRWNTTNGEREESSKRDYQKKKEQIAMIQIGQKIDDFIDDFEFEVYQNDEIKKS